MTKMHVENMYTTGETNLWTICNYITMVGDTKQGMINKYGSFKLFFNRQPQTKGLGSDSGGIEIARIST